MFVKVSVTMNGREQLKTLGGRLAQPKRASINGAGCNGSSTRQHGSFYAVANLHRSPITQIISRSGRTGSTSAVSQYFDQALSCYTALIRIPPEHDGDRAECDIQELASEAETTKVKQTAIVRIYCDSHHSLVLHTTEEFLFSRKLELWAKSHLTRGRGPTAEPSPSRQQLLSTTTSPMRSALGRVPRCRRMTLLACKRLDTWGDGENCQIRRTAIFVLVSLLYLHVHCCCIAECGEASAVPNAALWVHAPCGMWGI